MNFIVGDPESWSVAKARTPIRAIPGYVKSSYTIPLTAVHHIRVLARVDVTGYPRDTTLTRT